MKSDTVVVCTTCLEKRHFLAEMLEFWRRIRRHISTPIKLTKKHDRLFMKTKWGKIPMKGPLLLLQQCTFSAAVGVQEEVWDLGEQKDLDSLSRE